MASAGHAIGPVKYTYFQIKRLVDSPIFDIVTRGRLPYDIRLTTVNVYIIGRCRIFELT